MCSQCTEGEHASENNRRQSEVSMHQYSLLLGESGVKMELDSREFSLSCEPGLTRMSILYLSGRERIKRTRRHSPVYI